MSRDKYDTFKLAIVCGGICAAVWVAAIITIANNVGHTDHESKNEVVLVNSDCRLETAQTLVPVARQLLRQTADRYEAMDRDHSDTAVRRIYLDSRDLAYEVLDSILVPIEDAIRLRLPEGVDYDSAVDAEFEPVFMEPLENGYNWDALGRVIREEIVRTK